MSTAAANLPSPKLRRPYPSLLSESEPAAPFFVSPTPIVDPDPDHDHVAPSDAAPQPDPSDKGDAGDGATGARKSAWNRPSNGANELGGAVMDAAAWPLLSESARASPKSSSSESLKSFSDGSAAAPAEHVVLSPSPQTKPASMNSSGTVPTRQRSMKRSGVNANVSVTNGGQMPPIGSGLGDKVQITADNPVVVEIPVRDAAGKNVGGWEHGGKTGGFSPQGHGRNEHHRAYGGNHRKGSNSGGMHHNSNNFRHDQDRHGYEWNQYVGFGGKNVAMSPYPRPMQRPFFQAPLPGPGHFMNPPPMRPFGSPIGIPEVAAPMIYAHAAPLPHDPLRAVMPYGPQPVVFFPAQDPELRSALLKQIDYYFSNENLCRDTYLRERMNEEGWVPVTLIANFNRVKSLTNDIHFILNTLRASSVVEVQGDKVRRRNDWSTWIIPPQANRETNQPSSDVPVINNLAGRMRNIGIGEGTGGQSSTGAPARTFNGSSGI